MHQEISSGTIDAPSWEIVRTAKLASRIYVPLGTKMSLGDYVRVTRIFVEAFSDFDRMRDESSHEGEKVEYTEEDVKLLQLRRDLQVVGLLRSLDMVAQASLTELSRPAFPLGYQRRSYPSTPHPTHDSLPPPNPSHLVTLPIYNLSPGSLPLAPRLLHHVLRSTQLQKNRPNLGHLGRDRSIQTYLRAHIGAMRLVWEYPNHPTYSSDNSSRHTKFDVDDA
jgi:hypothetical protein